MLHCNPVGSCAKGPARQALSFLLPLPQPIQGDNGGLGDKGTIRAFSAAAGILNGKITDERVFAALINLGTFLKR